jgi:two-component sensor histidine kinase
MNMDQGIAVGMVISELISNAFKHAFPADSGGNVWVHLKTFDLDSIELVIVDDGTGLPPEIDLKDLSSLGLRLATRIVTHELGGSIEMENNGGARFSIRFKCKKKL